jgi:2-oxoacid:acceptor oxidoreductase delta subunit (pyruvate/2-ketoisovalerate family)
MLRQLEISKIKGMVVNDRTKRGGQFVGNWALLEPELVHEKCLKCLLCLLYCPEAAIRAEEEKMPKIDMRFCKGCGICANECPVEAIIMKMGG